MLTLMQQLQRMFTIQELYEIEDKILNGISEKELCQIFAGRAVYVSEGTYGDIPIEELPVPYKEFVDNILSIKSKNTTLYGGNISLFNLTIGKLKSRNLHHHIFTITPTPYIEFTNEKIDTKEIFCNSKN